MPLSRTLLHVTTALLGVMLLLGGCVSADGGKQSHSGPSPRRIYAEQVPADVFDLYSFKAFLQRFPQESQSAGLAINPDGTFQPTGQFDEADWRPTFYGDELLNRLDLRSFPSLLAGFTSDSRRTHRSPEWQELFREERSLTMQSENLVCTYVVFATADLNNNGVRDWLVLMSQQSRNDDRLRLGFWLLVTDPQPKGLLQARLLGVDEYVGLSARPVPASEAKDFIATMLRERVLPAAGRTPARQ